MTPNGSAGLVVAFLLAVPGVGEMERGEAALAYAGKQSENATALSRYTWREKVEFSVEGQTKVVRTNQVAVGPDGTMRKREVSHTSKVKQKKGLRGHAQKKQMAKTKEMWEKIVTLVQSYIHRTPGEFVDFFQAATLRDGIGLMEGSVKVTGTAVIKPEDELKIWVDAGTSLPVRMEIHTWIEHENGDRWMVDAQIEYQSLADGTAYPASSTVDLPLESMQLTIGTSDYKLDEDPPAAAEASGD